MHQPLSGNTPYNYGTLIETTAVAVRLMNSILDTIARLIDAVSMLSDCGAEVASPGAGRSAGSSSSGAGGAAGGAWVANSVDA